MPDWAKPLWELAVHVWVGTAIFLIIYAPAVGMNLLVHWLTTLPISKYLVHVVELAEYTLVGADTILYIVFLCKTTWRACKNI